MWTVIEVKAKYSETGIKQHVRIIYNPYNEPAKNILNEWIIPEKRHECTARNYKDSKSIPW